MSALKSVVAAISPVGHVAWTGSAMVTFLNHARMVPTNGFMLMAHMRFVQLGGTPSPSAAHAMAVALGQAYVVYQLWPERVQKLANSGAMVTKLDSPATGGMLSARPALVAHVLGLMDTASTGSAETMADAAVRKATEKLRAESRGDFTAALDHLEMSPEIKQGLFELARGNRQRLDDLQLGPMATKMLLQLCEAPLPGSKHASTILPPYASFVKECLNEDGDVIVRWAGKRSELGDKLRGTLIFLSEAYKRRHFTDVLLRRISAAVVESLRANGIGVKDPNTHVLSAMCNATDISKVPVLAALLQDPSNSELADAHAHKLNDSLYSLVIGFHVLRWARNVASHRSGAGDVLAKKGLPVFVLDAAARAAAAAVCSGPEHKGFAFQMDDKGIPERVNMRGNLKYSS